MDDTAGLVARSAMRATAHPVRLRILSLLTGASLSAAEIARELGIAHASASYHLRFLADAGLVVEAGEERIRGGTAKRYRHPWDEPRAGRSSERPGDAEGYIRAMAQELVRRYAQRSEPGSLTDAELWVTPEVAERVRATVHEAAILLHGGARAPRTPGTVPVAMTAAVFGLAHDGTAGDPRPAGGESR